MQKPTQKAPESNRLMRATAQAPANIALIKFWGKRNETLRLPMNDSISLNLSSASTVTTVEFINNLREDKLILDGLSVTGEEKSRVTKHLNVIREMAKISTKAIVTTNNNFPRGAGMASSASGFAALSKAASVAAGLKLDERQLSILARLGSGSACRSVPDGWVEWKEGKDSNSSYAHSIHNFDYWDICDVIAIVEKEKKKVTSTEGHAIAESSPFYKTRIKDMGGKIKKIKKYIKTKNFTKMGEIVESEALNMHAVMITSKPALIYWNGITLKLMVCVREWREEGLETYFTIDAGPNVHIICRQKDAQTLVKKLKDVEGVVDVVTNEVSRGVHLV